MATVKHNVKYRITAKDLSKKVFKRLNAAFPTIQSAAVLGTAAIAGLGFGVIKATQHFSEFETEVVNLGKVTSLPIEGLKRRILDLPPALGTAKNLTKGLYQTISAGVTEPNKAFELLTAAAKTAKGGHIALDTTVKALTKVMAGYAGEIKTAADASDLLFAIERSGQTNVADLAEQIGGLASISKNLNVSTTELGGAFSTLTLTASDTAEAATQYKAIMVALIKPSTEMKEALEQMGFDEASEAIGELGLSGVLSKLSERTKGSAQELGKLFGKQRALIGVTQLLSNNMAPLNKNIAAVADRAGLASKAFDDFKFTIKGLYETFKSVVGGIVIEVMDKLAPDIKFAMTAVTAAILDNKQVIIDYAVKFVESVKDVLDTTDLSFSDVVRLAEWMASSMVVISLKTVSAINQISTALLLLKKDGDKTATSLDKSFAVIGKSGGDFLLGLEGGFKDAEGIFGALGAEAGFQFDVLKASYDFFTGIIPRMRALVESLFNAIIDIVGRGLQMIIDFGLSLAGIEVDVVKMSGSIDGAARKIAGSFAVTEKAADTMANGITESMEKAIEGPKTLNETLKEVAANFEAPHEFIIEIEDGLVKISNIHDELAPARWSDELKKDFTIDNTGAISSISNVTTKLATIPPVTTKALEVETVKPELNLDKVIGKFDKINDEVEKDRTLTIDVKPAIDALDELLERFKKLNKIEGLETSALTVNDASALTNDIATGLPIEGTETSNNVSNSSQNITVNSNVTVDAGSQDAFSLARGLDDAIARQISRGGSKIPAALNKVGP